jgi:hypothetical protein
MEKPRRAPPVRMQLINITGPVVRRFRTNADAKPDMAEQTVRIRAITPIASRGCPQPERIEGHATPRTESGNPRLINAA